MGSDAAFNLGFEHGAWGVPAAPPADEQDQRAYFAGFREGRSLRHDLRAEVSADRGGDRKPESGLTRAEGIMGLVIGAILVVAAVTLLDWITPERVDPWRGLEILSGRAQETGATTSEPGGGGDEAAARLSPAASGSAGRSKADTDVSPQTRLVKSDQFDSSVNPGFQAFARVHAAQRPVLDLDRLSARARHYIEHTQCSLQNDRWVCRLQPAGFPFRLWSEAPWRLEWRLDQARDETGARLRVTSRLELEHPALAQGGVALGEREAARTGVAVVCPERGGELACSAYQMRVAFNLTAADEVGRFPSLFRTIGYDWIRRQRAPELPYDAETFALASLYKITGRLRDSGRLRSGDEDLFSREDLDRFADGVSKAVGHRVGNRSDYQLGMSRGACVLAHGAAPARVEPAAFTPDLPSMPRSIHIDGAPGVPCAMFINWRLQQLGGIDRDRLFAPERGFPDGYFSGHLRYEVTGDGFDPQLRQRALSLRGTAMTLYLLGFETRFSPQDQRIVGQWPRPEIIPGD